MSEPDFELVAASLRADAHDLATFVDALGSKLETALPGRSSIKRRSVRRLSKGKRVERIEVDLGDDRFVLAYDGTAVDARRARAVRGVVLKSEALSLEAWVSALAHAVAAEAQVSEEGRRSIERLLGIGPPT